MIHSPNLNYKVFSSCFFLIPSKITYVFNFIFQISDVLVVNIFQWLTLVERKSLRS